MTCRNKIQNSKNREDRDRRLLWTPTNTRHSASQQSKKVKVLAREGVSVMTTVLCRHVAAGHRLIMGRGRQSRRLSLCRRRSASTTSTTYYDSQSGLHVPVHNESEISLFLNLCQDNTFIPRHLYKEDSSSDMPDTLRELQQIHGVHGLVLPPATFPRDARNLQTLSYISPPGFQLFSFITPSQNSGSNNNISVLVPYEHNPTTTSQDDDDSSSTEQLVASLKQHVKAGLQTTFVLQLNELVDEEPIMVANQIASVIDEHGGGDALWLTMSSTDGDPPPDDILEMCEELAYLDLPGATVKSRLIIDAVNEEVVEEVMMFGVNKFAIDNLDMVPVVREIAEEQGKELLLKET